ncbi:MAG: DUF3823 domain-containing protein [Sphingobacteriaceae bacterium]|nr:MAG: DUF3823 domain-containing protein [Sphingobacteriaceae bacterium]
MKYILYMAVLVLASCKLDNYPAPEAGLSGRFLDAETNEPVGQDLGNGVVVELREHGYNPVTPQGIAVKADGSYQNKMLFANTYSIVPTAGNFNPIDTQTVVIKGQTVFDFKVTPYLRVKDTHIEVVGTKVVAKFKVEQVNTDVPVQQIGLYADVFPNVGRYAQVALIEQDIYDFVDPNQEYTLELDIPANSDNLKVGSQYYFRVGALIQIDQAKTNYGPTFRLTL